jgi:MFS family permease
VTSSSENRHPWYQGVTHYQWLVLLIASLGWVFDVFEGQIYVATMNESMRSLLPESERGNQSFYNNLALAGFLAGGAIGGVFFGWLSDRLGRTRTMIFTIAMYSAFTLVSALSLAWWHLVGCRFLVAMGVGGEWAVASALVAEVFPSRARAWSLAIFHASSVLGTLLAVAAGFWITTAHDLRMPLAPLGLPGDIDGWRLGFLAGSLPALLIIWIRLSLREPESWQQARAARQAVTRGGQLTALFSRSLRTRTLVGIGLAAVGLATFWGVHIYGKDLLLRTKENGYLAEVLARGASPDLPERLRRAIWEVHHVSWSSADSVPWLRTQLKDQELKQLLQPYQQALKQWELLGMFLVTVGGGLGLVAFGPLCEWLGRRGAFFLFQIGGFLVSLILFQILTGTSGLIYMLPVFGFLTLGMHAGFAVYFPELFPTWLRGSGTGVCFNVGRVLAAPVLVLSGWMQKDWHWSLETSASVLSVLFLVGPLLLLAAPETRGIELE